MIAGENCAKNRGLKIKDGDKPSQILKIIKVGGFGMSTFPYEFVLHCLRCWHEIWHERAEKYISITTSFQNIIRPNLHSRNRQRREKHAGIVKYVKPMPVGISEQTTQGLLQGERTKFNRFVDPNVRGAKRRVYSDLRIYCNRVLSST